SEAPQRSAERRQIVRFGRLTDGLGKPLHRMIVLVRPEREVTHEVEGIGVMRFERESLFAAKLRIHPSPGLQMIHARRIKRVDSGCTARGFSGFPGGGPTLVTVHRHLSKFLIEV